MVVFLTMVLIVPTLASAVGNVLALVFVIENNAGVTTGQQRRPAVHLIYRFYLKIPPSV